MLTTLAFILMTLYMLKEFYLWVTWLRAKRGGELDDDLQDPANTENVNIRQIERNGYIYTSPTQREDKENSTFEWGVKRFRVEGEELVEEKNYGKISDFREVHTSKPDFYIDPD
jgi:hypothetical protein